MNHKERSFGVSVGTVCGLATLFCVWRARPTAAWVLGVLALWLLLSAYLRPSLLRIPSGLWWRGVHIVGRINSRLLLSAIFYCVLTPVGLVLRTTGWDALRRRAGERGSGWMPYPARRQNAKHYEKMY